MEPTLLDTDTLSKIMKGGDAHVRDNARQYLATFDRRHYCPGGHIYALLYQRGQLISDADILIAATALQHHRIMVSENREHFRRIPTLTVESWRV